MIPITTQDPTRIQTPPGPELLSESSQFMSSLQYEPLGEGEGETKTVNEMEGWDPRMSKI